MNMTPLMKLNVYHNLIMQRIAGDILLKVGELKECWKKGDHIQHTSDSLEGQIKLFNKQLDILIHNIENEDEKLIRNSLSTYKNDRNKLKHNSQYDRVHKELFGPLKEYIESLNNVIDLLEIIVGETYE